MQTLRPHPGDRDPREIDFVIDFDVSRLPHAPRHSPPPELRRLPGLEPRLELAWPRR
ncbi:MAG: hypothetical protein KC636_07785 [Myxococcales bacterium]|nr:hypothetical protein [Myxococcales bacterium]